MKRDMDLIKKILLITEAAPQWKIPFIEGYTSEQVGYHAYILYQAGLIEGSVVTRWDEGYPEVIPCGLTWEGYNFLDTCRGDTSVTDLLSQQTLERLTESGSPKRRRNPSLAKFLHDDGSLKL